LRFERRERVHQADEYMAVIAVRCQDESAAPKDPQPAPGETAREKITRLRG
jgi:hypothetical protein